MTTTAVDRHFLAHQANLEQKKRLAKGDQVKLVASAEAAYVTYVSHLDPAKIAARDFDAAVGALDTYINVAKDLEKKDKLFNWRSNFAGSVIPEFMYRAVHAVLLQRKVVAFYSTRNSAVELTLSGSRGWTVRHKDQDLCVGVTYVEVAAPSVVKVLVPVVAMEVKTNIDINKLNGLDFSAEMMKRTFPASNYLLATETIDFSLADNYASGSINEIYVLRKQMRSASRRTKAPLVASVFSSLIR